MPHLQLTGCALQAEKSTRREKERGGAGSDAKQSKVHFVVRSPNDVIKQIDAWLAQQEGGKEKGG